MHMKNQVLAVLAVFLGSASVKKNWEFKPSKLKFFGTLALRPVHTIPLKASVYSNKAVIYLTYAVNWTWDEMLYRSQLNEDNLQPTAYVKFILIDTWMISIAKEKAINIMMKLI